LATRKFGRGGVSLQFFARHAFLCTGVCDSLQSKKAKQAPTGPGGSDELVSCFHTPRIGEVCPPALRLFQRIVAKLKVISTLVTFFQLFPVGASGFRKKLA
jgi:hypothetical protein